MKTQSAHLLLVDDETIVLRALKNSLELEGYKVSIAHTPMEALEQAKTTSFAAVLSDQRMPKMEGVEFLSLFKHVQPCCSRVLLTGALDSNVLIDVVNRAEIFRFLPKPWQREELLNIVSEAVVHHLKLKRLEELEI